MQLTYDYVKRTNKYIMKNFFVFFFFSFVLRLVFVLLLCNSALIKYFCAFTLFFFWFQKEKQYIFGRSRVCRRFQIHIQKSWLFQEETDKRGTCCLWPPKVKAAHFKYFQLIFSIPFNIPVLSKLTAIFSVLSLLILMCTIQNSVYRYLSRYLSCWYYFNWKNVSQLWLSALRYSNR